MSSPWIQSLRSVALNLPDLVKAEAFYTQVWKLSVVAREPGAIYLRGTGADHHLLSIHAERLCEITIAVKETDGRHGHTAVGWG